MSKILPKVNENSNITHKTFNLYTQNITCIYWHSKCILYNMIPMYFDNKIMMVNCYHINPFKLHFWVGLNKYYNTHCN